MNDKIEKIGYLFVGPKTPSLAAQSKALLEEGVAESQFWIDTAKSRPERRDMIDLALPPNVDRMVVIATPAIIGSGQKDTAKAVLAIGAKNVAVMVCGSDPVIYTDEEKAMNFATEAVRVSRITNARITASGGKQGRPEKWEMTKEAEELLRILWHDTRVPMARILDVVAWLGGATVTRENLYSRLGPREVSENN